MYSLTNVVSLRFGSRALEQNECLKIPAAVASPSAKHACSESPTAFALRPFHRQPVRRNVGCPNVFIHLKRCSLGDVVLYNNHSNISHFIRLFMATLYIYSPNMCPSDVVAMHMLVRARWSGCCMDASCCFRNSSHHARMTSAVSLDFGHHSNL